MSIHHTKSSLLAIVVSARILQILWILVEASHALSLPSTTLPQTEHELFLFRYVALYKPALTLTSWNDDGPRALRKNRNRRPTLLDCDNLPADLHICGRLDRDSEGLLLLTDDGQFTDAVLSGATGGSCEKTYWALVQGHPTEAAVLKMRQGGLAIRGTTTRPPVSVRLFALSTAQKLLLPNAALGMDRHSHGGCSWLEIILTEGRHRQVRRIAADAGHPVLRLVRVAIGSLSLQLQHEPDDTTTTAATTTTTRISLQPGEWCVINKVDVLGDKQQHQQ
jgi:23S rRNA pseudouridine2457 synthase